MAVFFQKIPDSQFNAEKEFIVKESQGINIFMGLLPLVMGFAMISTSLVIAGFMFISALALLLKAARNVTIIVINKNGFYHYGTLITRWSNFVDVTFSDETRVPSQNSAGITDNFSLVFTYYKDDKPGCYQRKIPLTNAQDKPEEEILAAVKFYAAYYKKKDVVSS